jgi:hypothetical protein
MNKFLLIFFLLFSNNIFSQSEKEVKFLDYANNKIEVPKNCSSMSEYQLLNCDGISVRWMHVDQKELKLASEQLINKFSKKYKYKERIEVISFGATLKGYKFSYKNSKSWNRIIVFGIVNKQPLILNVASEDELIAISNSNEFLKKIMKISR